MRDDKATAFEKMLSAYLEDGKLPEDVDVNGIMEQLRIQEKVRIREALVYVTSLTKEYMRAMKWREYEVGRKNVESAFWNGSVKYFENQQFATVLDSARDSLNELQKMLNDIDREIHFSGRSWI